MFLWLIHVDLWQKTAQYCKEVILQLKVNFFFFLKSNSSKWVSERKKPKEIPALGKLG